MELRHYGRIIWRRLWIIVVLLGGVLLSYLFFAPQAPMLYSANMRFVVGLKPEPAAEGYYRYDRYYTWLTAEYLLDDLAEVVKSRAFAADVATLAGLDIPAGAIQGATSAGKLHRILSVHVTWPQPDELQRISEAIVQTLRERGAVYFAQLGTESAVISLIDPPTIGAVGPSLRQRLDLPLRLFWALGVGIGLAFLLDYLDDSLRDREDVEALGVRLLAEVPGRSSWMRFWRHRSAP